MKIIYTIYIYKVCTRIHMSYMYNLDSTCGIGRSKFVRGCVVCGYTNASIVSGCA